MTYIPDLYSGSDCETDEVAKELLSEGREKEIKSAIQSMIVDEFEYLSERASEHISQVAGDRAKLFLDNVLRGDEEAARKLFGGCDLGNRYRTIGCRNDEPWASLIHGSLFETGSVVLRRKLVEAHPDLLSNERIADLESVVDGLSRQVRKLEGELAACYERLR